MNNLNSDSAKIFQEHLPLRARVLAEIIGLPALQKLVKWRGGVSLYIPKNLTDTHPLVECVGQKAANALAKTYSSETIEIPNCKSAVLAATHADIIRRHTAGESETQIALAFGMWGRSVRRILAEWRAEQNERSAT